METGGDEFQDLSADLQRSRIPRKRGEFAMQNGVAPGRNPNVFYELGLAHALHKPVVLVASNEQDVPFDVKHIRVIYYDVQDPFWGEKLIAKLSENVLSAISNPQEAIFKKPVS